MSQTDPIADMLTRIRNAAERRHLEVRFPASKLKLEVVRLLKEHGYATSYEVVEQDKKHEIVLTLAFQGKKAVIVGLNRLSKPGQRVYADAGQLKKYRKKNQLTIVSTSGGVMTSVDAVKKSAGGELICTIW